jgi:tetratricopeptide (TPR) repeat protein
MREICLLNILLFAIYLSSCASTALLETRNSKSVNGLIERGLRYYAEEDYENAGITLKRALDSYPARSGRPPGLRHSAEDIRSLIKTCAARLREEGLREYRNGNLENAITQWRKILLFNKENAPTIKKMIETAALQLENLKKLKMEK